MTRKSGNTWHCTDTNCRAVAVVPANMPENALPPSCFCGAKMKKEYKPPVFRYLDFLRPAGPVLVSSSTDRARPVKED